MIGITKALLFWFPLQFLLAVILPAPKATAEALLMAGAAACQITPTDADGRLWQEPYIDKNGNARYDPPNPDDPGRTGEPFTDLNRNGKWDGPFLAGFLHRGRYYTATGIHDPLWARAIILEMGRTRVALVALDLIGLFYPNVLQIRERVADLGLTQVVVASTHTHGGIDTLGLWGPNFSTDGKDPRTMAWIIRQSEKAIRKAWDSRRPAQLVWGKRRPPSRFGPLINDIRDPIVTDDMLLVMKAIDLNGKTIATLVNWSLHPEVMGGTSSLTTSDFPHYLRKGIEEGGFTVMGRSVKGIGGITLYFSGSIGGLMTPLGSLVNNEEGEPIPERSWTKTARIGEIAAWTALEAIRGKRPQPVSRVAVRSKTFFLPFDNILLRDLLEKGVFQRETYIDGKPAGTNGEDLLTEVDVIEFYGNRGIIAQFITVPGELFPEIANGGYLEEIGRCWRYTKRKRRLGGGKERTAPAHPDIPPEPILRHAMTGAYRFIIGLGNDELGYIIPANDFVPPRLKPKIQYGTDRCGDDDHYEELLSASSKLAPRVTASLMELLK